MPKKKTPKLPPTPEGKVKKWLQCRLTIKKAEQLFDALKPFVQTHLKSSGGKCQVGTSNLSLIEVPKPYFNIKKAEEVLGEKALAPFWEKGSYLRINVD